MKTEETFVDDVNPEKVNESEGSESFAGGPACCEEMMGPDFKAMEMCPMSGMCKGMMKQGAWSSSFMLLPAVFMIAFGLLIILMPQVLAWLLGGMAIFMGVMFLLMANQFRKFANGRGRRES